MAEWELGRHTGRPLEPESRAAGAGVTSLYCLSSLISVVLEVTPAHTSAGNLPFASLSISSLPSVASPALVCHIQTPVMEGEREARNGAAVAGLEHRWGPWDSPRGEKSRG